MDLIDVGQGDAVFIQSPDCKTALIDGGDAGSGTILRSHLASIGVTSLDMVIVSHMHQDHLGGIVELAQGSAVPVAVAYDRGGTYASATYTNYASLYAGKRQTPSVGQTISLGSSVSFTVMGVNTSTSNENDRSIVLKMSYGDLNVLLGGDMESTTEATLAPSIGPVEVYKVDHHGSSGASNSSLMALTQPDVSLISLGIGNTYGHPAADALARLTPWGDVFQTEDPATGIAGGTITLTSDGTNYEITQDGATYAYVANAAGGVVNASAVSITRGTTTSALSTVNADDSSRWTLTSSKSGTNYQNDWTYSYTLPTTTPGAITVAWNSKNSASSAMKTYLYNYQTAKWDSVGSATVGTTEDTLTWSASAPTAYVSTTGAVKVRFVGPQSTKSYTSYTDAAWLVWEP